MSSVEQKNCSSCGEGFTCGAGRDAERCWCEALPHLPLTAIESRDCLCPKCLSDIIQSLEYSGRQTAQCVRDTRGTSVDPQSLLIEGEDYYSEGTRWCSLRDTIFVADTVATINAAIVRISNQPTRKFRLQGSKLSGASALLIELVIAT